MELLSAPSLPALRLLLFMGLLLALMAAEAAWPRRNGGQNRRHRWLGNLSLSASGAAINNICMQFISALSPIAAALWAEQANVGALRQVALPAPLEIAASLLILDGVIWAQHWVFHRVPLLWRLHRVHHSDPEFDVTTAVRFHPLELLLSLAVKSAAAVLLGISASAVALFEILLSSSALLTHANLRLPATLDTLLRRLFITPDLHRIHHSPEQVETDSNFGFCLSVWDRMVGTYRAQPRDGHTTMKIGLPVFRADRDQRLECLLTQPLLRQEDESPPAPPPDRVIERAD